MLCKPLDERQPFQLRIQPWNFEWPHTHSFHCVAGMLVFATPVAKTGNVASWALADCVRRVQS